MPVAGDVPPPAISDHHAHPGHNLKRVANDGRFFICDGCMEPGAGTRYRCEHERCNFDLHTCCAVAPDTMTHPLLGDHVFVFLLEAPAVTTTGGNKDTGKRRVCVACGEDVRGFVYHSFDDEELDIHPCCASLPEHAVRDGRVVALGNEVPRPRDMTGDDNRRREIRPAAARHRRWPGWLGGRRDQPPRERTQQDGHVVVLRHVASQPSDVSDDRNRRGERRPPPARHRGWQP